MACAFRVGDIIVHDGKEARITRMAPMHDDGPASSILLPWARWRGPDDHEQWTLPEHTRLLRRPVQVGDVLASGDDRHGVTSIEASGYWGNNTYLPWSSVAKFNWTHEDGTPIDIPTPDAEPPALKAENIQWTTRVVKVDAPQAEPLSADALCRAMWECDAEIAAFIEARSEMALSRLDTTLDEMRSMAKAPRAPYLTTRARVSGIAWQRDELGKRAHYAALAAKVVARMVKG